MPEHNLRHYLFVAVVGWATGCGSANTSPVSGQVTYKGKPVPAANVSYTPAEGAGLAASGVADDNGRYTLGTKSANDGATVGKYRVTISAFGPPRPLKSGEMGVGMPGETMRDPIIPTKYSNPETSGLSFEVKRGTNSANFELTD